MASNAGKDLWQQDIMLCQETKKWRINSMVLHIYAVNADYHKFLRIRMSHEIL